MKIFLIVAIRKIFDLLGLRVQRLNKDVNIDSALEEQLRLAGDNITSIFEVGAADGRDCLVYTSRCPNATIYAFEPLPDNFKKLQEKATIESRIVPVNAAMSNIAGEATFYVTALDDASSLLQPRETNSTFDKYMTTKSEIKVEVRTIDDECAIRKIGNIDLLKMDAQGAELLILQGSAAMLKNKSVKVIYAEVQFIRLYKNACLYYELADFLAGYGYYLHDFYNLIHNQNGQLSWGDAIFLPDENT